MVRTMRVATSRTLSSCLVVVGNFAVVQAGSATKPNLLSLLAEIKEDGVMIIDKDTVL